MPCSYHRDDSRRVVVVVSSGTLTLDEWAAVVARQASEGVWRYGILYDFTALDEIASFELKDVVRDVREMVAQFGVRGPVAVVAPGEPVHARMVEWQRAAADLPFKTRVFRDAGLADEWIDAEMAKPLTGTSP